MQELEVLSEELIVSIFEKGTKRKEREEVIVCEDDVDYDPWAVEEAPRARTLPPGANIHKKHEFYKEMYPTYPWGIPNMTTATNRPLGNFSIKKSKKHKLGKIYMPYWEAFHKYIKNLVWEDDEESSRGVTFLELVVDYELASGLELRHPKYGRKTPWNLKAEMVSKLYKYLCNVYPSFKTPKIKRHIRPLTSFGAARQVLGLDVRCKLMTNQNAEVAVIENIVKYLNEGTAGNSQSNRVGSINHILMYKHIPSKPVITTESTKQFGDKMIELIANRGRRPKYRLKYKQPVRSLRE